MAKDGAKNTPTVTVSFDANGATSGTVPKKQKVSVGSSITLPGAGNLARTRYDFNGWNTKADGTGTNYDGGSSYTVNGDITLFAKWDIMYTVSFNPNGATSGTGPVTQKVIAGSTIPLPRAGSLRRDGYIFHGWNTRTSANYPASILYTVNENITLYASWTSINTPCTVTFDINGGSGTNPSGRTANAGSTITLPGENGFSRDGYIFGGWNIDPSGMGNNYPASSSYTVTGETTLYAKWTLLTGITVVGEYLATRTGTVNAPVFLPMQMDLGIMTQANSGWQLLLAAIATAGDFVELDLSACTMSGTEFNPDYNVTAGKDRIVSIALPDTAKSIAAGAYATIGAFRGFTALKTFSGTGLTTIGSYAFYGCTSLTMTSLPAGVTTISSNTFRDCTNLALVSLPVGLTTIGERAFKNCTSLALASLPVGLTTIGNYAFQNCTSLALAFLPVRLTTIGEGAFQSCTNLTLASLPVGVTSISDYAFSDCTNLALISLPERLTTIGDGAFQSCTNLALTSLPAGVTSISNYAFSQCTNLALTSLPERLTSIGDVAFYGCTNLDLTSLPAGLTSIGRTAFEHCTSLALTSLPAGITTIGSYTFTDCTNLAQISLPAGLTTIGDSAFRDCTKLARVTCHAVTPPTLGANVFTLYSGDIIPNLRIEVPAGSFAAYWTDGNWSAYASRIIAIGSS